MNYPTDLVKSFLEICYGVPTKLTSIGLAKLLNLAIFLQADRIIQVNLLLHTCETCKISFQTVGKNLAESSSRNPRLWVAILFAFGHLADPAISFWSRYHLIKFKITV